eukprot:CAMPEP_0195065160 /NCGR_PEP_ID=MMETSP0448-20130528/10899_1 /TAXON_ID=66468 /ORGANISM="Heterocapsa triquestra, Strain CCMP 448" /LENGTH=181 /DNA_ID=CAMNT_0040096231 /DNA_START=123 /DNA_END=668 /DNA_ORIENTATION=-
MAFVTSATMLRATATNVTRWLAQASTKGLVQVSFFSNVKDSQWKIAKSQKRVRFSPLNEIIEIPSRETGAKKGYHSASALARVALFMRAQKNASRKKRLQDFLASEGFDMDVNSSRRTLFKTTFPLHVACKRGDVKVVELLMTLGADETLQDSMKRTPADIAKKCNHSGSHDAVLRALGSH